MVEINILYQGELRCSANHPSGTEIFTDAPKDNHGKGESFSPTDLVATALGTCIATTMGILAQKMRIDIAGTKVKVIKEMVAEPVRRIGRLVTTIEVPTKHDESQKERLMRAAEICPVHASLHPDVQKPIEWVWA